MSNFMNTAVLNDIMTTAIEGGSAYWMNDDDICRKVIIKRESDGTVVEIKCETDVDGKGWVEHMLTHTIIRKALTEMKDDVKLGERWNKLAGKMLFDKDTDYDAGDADSIVQYAMFKDIVLG